MTNGNATSGRRSIRRGAVVALALALGAAALPAAPASAHNEFEVRVVLSGGVPYGPYAYHHDYVPAPSYEVHHYYSPPPPVRYYKKHRHHRRHRDCDVEYRYEVRERYSRGRDRHDDDDGYWRDRRSGWRY